MHFAAFLVEPKPVAFALLKVIIEIHGDDSDTSTVIGLRDRALITVMIYSWLQYS